MIANLIKAMHVNSVRFHSCHVALGVLSMTIHQLEIHELFLQMNVCREFSDMRRKILPLVGPESRNGKGEWGYGPAKLDML